MNLNDSDITCIAHRGGAKAVNLVENTIAAIEHSLGLGVKAIEIDVWSLQGQLLVVHDRRLGRLIPGDENIMNFSAADLTARAYNAGIEIPTLEEVVKTVGDRAELNIEIKGPNCAKTLAATIESLIVEHQLPYDQFLVSSFDHHQLYEFMTLNPSIRRGVLVEGVPLHLAQCCEPLNAYFLGASLDFVRQGMIDDCHKRGSKIWVYTVNHIDDMRHLCAMGVDGMFTDYPERLMNLLEYHQEPSLLNPLAGSERLSS